MALGKVNFVPLYTNLIACPLCGSLGVHRFLEAVRLSAEIDGDQVAADVVAWRCLENAHIFFLRKADLQNVLEEARSDFIS